MRASEIVRIATEERGYSGKKSNADLYDKTANVVGKYTKYSQELFEAGYYNGNKNGYSWCCCFKDWCFYVAAGRNKDAANAVCPTGVYGAGVKWAQMYMDKAGLISDTPEVGSVVFYIDTADGEYAHTGIVVGVNDTEITTIEGNWGKAVTQRVVKRTDPRIKCYGHPVYEAEPKPEPETPDQPDWGKIADLFEDIAKEFRANGK